MTREVMPYQGGIPALEASRARLAPALLVWDGNPWRTRPAACRVREGAAERDVALSWKAISLDSLDRLQATAAYGDASTEYGITYPKPGVAWVTVPSLAENVGDNKRGLENLIRALPGVRSARWIVLDVRGNHGGNTFWARQLLGAVFGEAYIDSVGSALAAQEYIQWRASKGNIEFIESNTLPRFDKGSPSHEAFVQVIASMRRAIANAEDLTPAPDDASVARASAPLTPQPLGSKFVLLTDGWCASACLGLADRALSSPRRRRWVAIGQGTVQGTFAGHHAAGHAHPGQAPALA